VACIIWHVYLHGMYIYMACMSRWHVCMYVCMHVCMYVCTMHVCMYVCMHVCKYAIATYIPLRVMCHRRLRLMCRVGYNGVSHSTYRRTQIQDIRQRLHTNTRHTAPVALHAAFFPNPTRATHTTQHMHAYIHNTCTHTYTHMHAYAHPYRSISTPWALVSIHFSAHTCAPCARRWLRMVNMRDARCA